ncbi:hypothetical protein F442_08911 [Phytophthora nicotianae P10297]|uniref:Uncharacterized protein n=1 Tax=Phytophthora nicotianae P10297 TaxID=1317064 RepID=W2ZBN5_PHYNI|nr:hypothetical protein F442_08911 [Phytophthora nicotianae P10297]
MTIQRYKTRIRNGSISVAKHSKNKKKHASKVGVFCLVRWFERFAEEVGEVVPVRVRMQKTVNGTTQKYYSSRKYTLIPAHVMWDAIHDEMHTYIESGLSVYEPARSTMRKLLTLHYPTIRFRSPRSNVCDIYSIYYSGMRGNITADKTEALGRHTEPARRMR